MKRFYGQTKAEELDPFEDPYNQLD
jgi:hypothetical protein